MGWDGMERAFMGVGSRSDGSLKGKIKRTDFV